MKVNHEHTRLLREFAAHVGNHGTPQLRQKAIHTLQSYGKGVSKYCDHPDKVTVTDPNTGMSLKRCLDCGCAFDAKTEELIARFFQ